MQLYKGDRKLQLQSPVNILQPFVMNSTLHTCVCVTDTIVILKPGQLTKGQQEAVHHAENEGIPSLVL